MQRDEDTAFGRKTYFGEIMLLHPHIVGDPTGLILTRNEEMRYGVQVTRGDWNTFFSAQEVMIIADFVEHHHAWLEWGNLQNAGDKHTIPPDRYTARPGSQGDDDLSTYVLYSPICYFHPEMPNDPTGILLVCNEAGYYGACIVGNLVFPPTFYLAEDLIRIAKFVTKNRPWLERGKDQNAEHSANEAINKTYLTIRYSASADPERQAGVPDGTILTLLLFTNDGYAIYGLPATEQEQTGAFRWRAYPRQYWEEIAPLPEK